MFDECGEFFEEPGVADSIIAEAQSRLYNALTEAAKAVLDDVKSAKSELETIREETTLAEAERDRVKMKLERERKNLELYTRDHLPKEFVKRMVTAATGDFAPGDTVYVLQADTARHTCGLCHGRKKVSMASQDNQTYDWQCPRCNGYGYEYTTTFKVKETTVSEVRLKLCFENRSVSYWSLDTIFLRGEDWATSPDRLFRTREGAEAAAEAKNNGAAQS